MVSLRAVSDTTGKSFAWATISSAVISVWQAIPFYKHLKLNGMCSSPVGQKLMLHLIGQDVRFLRLLASSNGTIGKSKQN
jgi:hypothetical protein